MLLYNCDACGANFEIDPENPPEFGVFCPECGETELIKKIEGLENACYTEDIIEGTPRRG